MKDSNSDGLEERFYRHAQSCKKGNKCCFDPQNGSTQEFIQELTAYINEVLEEIIGEDEVEIDSPMRAEKHRNQLRAIQKERLRSQLRE